MNKKVSVGVTLSLILLAMAVTVSVTVMGTMRYFSSIVNSVTEREVIYDMIADIDEAVRGNYVGTIDEEALRQALAEGYASGYGDAYAQYYTAEEYAVISEQLEGYYTGFGIEVEVDGDAVVVTTVYSDSAAETAGVKKHDVITALDEKAVDGRSLAYVQSRLNNPAKLILSITREGQPHSFTLTATTIELDNVENKLLSDGETGYVRIRKLADNTPEQMRSALSVLSEDGATRYVLDLRDNAGGSMQAALDILDYLLPRVAYAHLAVGEGEEPIVYTSTSTSQMTDKMVVLVNERTEAEAELIAAALQESAKMPLIGVTTKGHAQAQQYFTLKSGNAAVYVTVGTWQCISGNTWENVGLKPDVAVKLAGDTPFVLREEADDTQLQAALTALGGVVNESITSPTAATTASTTSATTTTTTTTKE